MKTSKKINFVEWNKNIFVSSMKKIDFNIILIVVLDMLFYLLSGYIVKFWFQRMLAKAAVLNLPTDATLLGYESAQKLLSGIKSFYYLLIFSSILLLIAIIFLASILKGIIWAKTTNTKITFKLISKFLGLNLIWMSFWLIMVFLVSWIIEPSASVVLMPLVIFLAIYFTNTLYTIFMKEQKLRCIFSAIKLNIMEIHLLLLPYVVIASLLFVIIKLGNLLKFDYSTILFGLMVIAYFAFVRYYVSGLVVEIEKLRKSKSL